MPSILTEEYQIEERLVDEASPIKFIRSFLQTNKLEGVKPSIVLRYKDEFVETVPVYPDSVHEVRGHQPVTINLRTTAQEMIQTAMEKFVISASLLEQFCLVEMLVDQDVTKRVMNADEFPLQIIKQSRRESLCSNRMVRFYLHRRNESTEPSVPMFVDNLPIGLSQIQYAKILTDLLTKSSTSSISSSNDNNNNNNTPAKWSRFDVIYYEYGSLVMLYDDPDNAVRAYKILKDSYYENKQLMVLLLPTIQVYIYKYI